MGFYVRPSQGKRAFYVVEETWQPERKAATVPLEAYLSLGFRPDMSLEEARSRAKQLNLQSQLESRKKVAAAKRVADEKAIDKAYLPDADVAGFEAELRENYEGKEERLENLLKQWNVVKKMLSTLELDPKDFYTNQQRFLNYYRKRKKPWSPDYVKKLTWIVNQWGHFVSRKRGTFFQPLPRLRQHQAQDLRNMRDGVDGIKLPADPFEWERLKNARSTFENEGLLPQWNWMFIALWFGLRPIEVDNLLEKKSTWRVERGSPDVLWIYQTKLSNIEKEERWKPIPARYAEQKKALKVIEEGDFQRPLNKSLARLLGDNIQTYSPRKSFTDLMLDLGETIEDISIFLGHKNIQMSWRRYKDKRRFRQRKGA